MTEQEEKKKSIHNRMIYLVGLLIIGIVLVVGKLFWFQIVNGERLAGLLDAQIKQERDIQVPRGTIYDRNGRELAISVMREDLSLDPQDVQKNTKSISPEQMAAIIGPIIGVEPEEIMKKYHKGGRYHKLKSSLDPETAEAVRAAVKEHGIRGLTLRDNSKRFYPNGKLAAQPLGCVGTDGNGLLGLEKQYDKLLIGSVTAGEVEYDAKGRPISDSVYNTKLVDDGKDMYLTLDRNIQFIAESALDDALVKNKTSKGAALVVDPTTGEILAMVSRPTFDPNDFKGATYEEFKNRSIEYIYEPGSTFKSVVAAIALEEKLITPNEVIYDNGIVEVSGHKIKNWDGKANGSVTFTEIIKKSLNTGFVNVGLRIGADRLMEYAKVFGFGARTEVGLPGEGRGILFKSAKGMVNSDIATMAIGQSVAVTPIQLIMAVSALANDGVLLKPHLVREIKNPDGTVHESYLDREVVRQTVSPETAKTMRYLLEQVVADGGGNLAQVKGYRVAGKTGTAQKLNAKRGGYEEGAYIASFVGFAPADKPRIAVIVMIDNPSGLSYYGGTVAAPVAGRIMGEVLRYLNVLPDQAVPAELPRNARQMPKDMPASEVKSGSVTVPDVRGKTMKEAMRMLRSAGLTMVPEGTGIAVKQSIEPYIGVRAGTEMRVWFEPR